ncbi:MAG: hypothetical protein E6583_00735 [Clostridium sp.]|nr:hypothetical protein [Clostridium sp.]
MNIEKNLIFIKGEDKTDKVEYCKYNSFTKKYDVTFSGGAMFSTCSIKNDNKKYRKTYC